MRYLIFVLLLSTAAFSQVPPIEPGVSKSLAEWRAAHYSDVRYKLNLTLEKMSPVLKGTMEIRVKVEEAGSGGVRESEPGAIATGSTVPIILDWRKLAGHDDKSTISNVTINGRSVVNLWTRLVIGGGLQQPPSRTAEPSTTPEKDIQPASKEDVMTYLPQDEHLIFKDGVVIGENVIKLDFTSPILASGSAITRYIDKEDGSEYIYSLFVPSDASTAFPVFDQPDLKARFSLKISRPEGWKAISNTSGEEFIEGAALRGGGRSTGFTTDFPETKPISTYVFAFAAGPFEKITDAGIEGRNLSGSEGAPQQTSTPKGTLPTGRVSASVPDGSIYVRRSQAAKFKPHAAEVFRLNRESIKYFEEYFDYKFPFPKYDLVLIPEFPFGGMEHAGATFLRESAIIFPQEPTKSDHISRAVLIFHEAAHQWFGDTVTMKWFDDLWLKEGFANFMAYKALEKVGRNLSGSEGAPLANVNAWKVFYERIKQPAYATDSTRGTTPIYQPIDNLNSAKSAYGNIVYNKAPAFLKQAEFYLGPEKFQTAVRAFLKKHEYKNATWGDLVKEFENTAWPAEGYPYFKDLTKERQDRLVANRKKGVNIWANYFVKQKGVAVIKVGLTEGHYERRIPSAPGTWMSASGSAPALGLTLSPEFEDSEWSIKTKTLYRYGTENEITDTNVSGNPWTENLPRLFNKDEKFNREHPWPDLIFPNFLDHGYGIFLLDDKSREYVLKNVQNEKDAFLRSMMYGALWDSVREGELDPRAYVEVAIKNLEGEKDETIAQMMLNRTATALNYYVSEQGRNLSGSEGVPTSEAPPTKNTLPTGRVSALHAAFENVLIDRMQNASTLGQRITYFRALVANATTERSRGVLKNLLAAAMDRPRDVKAELKEAFKEPNLYVSMRLSKEELEKFKKVETSESINLRTKDKFDIVTRLAVLNDPDAAKLLAELEKTETSDDAKRYAYAARAAFPTKENREKFWNDFVNNKDISESWIEAAFGPFNAVRNSELSLPYLKRALEELPNHKRSRKIFFVNGWLAAFIGGQRSQESLDIVNKFLTDNPNLDKDLRLKILENVDVIERAVRIRAKYK